MASFPTSKNTPDLHCRLVVDVLNGALGEPWRSMKIELKPGQLRAPVFLRAAMQAAPLMGEAGTRRSPASAFSSSAIVCMCQFRPEGLQVGWR